MFKLQIIPLCRQVPWMSNSISFYIYYLHFVRFDPFDWIKEIQYLFLVQNFNSLIEAWEHIFILFLKSGKNPCLHFIEWSIVAQWFVMLAPYALQFVVVCYALYNSIW